MHLLVELGLGFTANYDILNFYKSNPVDLFINVSESEGIPVTIMEAMSYGILCLATDVGGVKEIVFEGVGNLLDPRCDPGMISEAITSELPNPAIDNKRNNAKLHSEKFYDSEKNYTDFVQTILNH